MGRETQFCSGCWRWVMLSSFLVLHLIPLYAHGNSFGANGTETDNKVNVSSPLNREDEQMAGVTGSISPVSLPVRAERKPRGGEEPGSGMLGEGIAPGGNGHEISLDSAENDHLLNVGSEGMGSNLPTLPAPRGPADVHLDFKDEKDQLPHTDPPWQRAKEHQEVTVFDLDRQPHSPTPSLPHFQPDAFTVDFFDPASRRRNLDLSDTGAHELQGGNPNSWELPEGYEYTTNYENSYSTIENQYTTVERRDESVMRFATAPPSVHFNPRRPDIKLPSGSAEDEEPPAAPGVVDATNGSLCRQGYVRHNATCRSVCDFFPSYCFNGGQCYLVEGAGVFCRCNVQDYIWHKGSRCESVITEFQVMCIAIGGAALMVLLLFMITVCFAKKLHLLKTENSKLRKRSSKYRPPSEQHNDNFSLSTIAEGSHPNKTMSRYTWECKTKEEPECEDDPNAQNKLEDPVKSPPPKEDEPLNIQNSLTPKHENNKAACEENSSEMCCSLQGGVTVEVEERLLKYSSKKPPASSALDHDACFHRHHYSSPELGRRGRADSQLEQRDVPPQQVGSPISTHSLPTLPTKMSQPRGGKAYTF
ncbi:chondroitin sulfate proteoglycan 5-like isoform X4 [Anguilla anguilla]|uniref:chondroitin sulfate proteoglycan 5-like isoform X4 n=1 Tax=Anguilla anguilla TaxID=7936 RepID=UPI0015B2B208|nr:chondroitin sulfate proteoglycan 5-like isoform X4 [Anguilla anguilla]